MSNSTDGLTASQLITKYIEGFDDWRGKRLAQLRELVHEAVPNITEELKWGTPVWSQKGMVCSASAFKDHVKLNFFKGAFLGDPQGLFNAGLDAKAMRAIDFNQGDEINASAIKDLVRAAVAYNTSGARS